MTLPDARARVEQKIEALVREANAYAAAISETETVTENGRLAALATDRRNEAESYARILAELDRLPRLREAASLVALVREWQIASKEYDAAMADLGIFAAHGYTERLHAAMRALVAYPLPTEVLGSSYCCGRYPGATTCDECPRKET